MDLDHLEKTNLFARAGGQLLPPGKNNSMTAASSLMVAAEAEAACPCQPGKYNTNGSGAEDGSGSKKFARKIKHRLGITAVACKRLEIQRAAWV